GCDAHPRRPATGRPGGPAERHLDGAPGRGMRAQPRPPVWGSIGASDQLRLGSNAPKKRGRVHRPCPLWSLTTLCCRSLTSRTTQPQASTIPPPVQARSVVTHATRPKRSTQVSRGAARAAVNSGLIASTLTARAPLFLGAGPSPALRATPVASWCRCVLL